MGRAAPRVRQSARRVSTNAEGDSVEAGPASCSGIGIGSGVAASDEADALGYEIVKFMRRRVDEYADAHDLNFTLLATPAEGL